MASTLLGCGLLQQHKEPSHWKELRKENNDPLHVYSCGPEALQKIFKRLGIQVSLKNLSHAIQNDFKCNTLIRDFLSVFINDARRISFPDEMVASLKKAGFKVAKIKKYEDLNKKTDTALILIKRKNSLRYHWMCFPIDKNILSFFGNDTVLKEIYLITK
jgi:hypothetical protein